MVRESTLACTASRPFTSETILSIACNSLVVALCNVAREVILAWNTGNARLVAARAASIWARFAAVGAARYTRVARRSFWM
jgi:hypothetical protein